MAAAPSRRARYVRERRQFGQPIGNFELVQGKPRRHVCIASMPAAATPTWSRGLRPADSTPNKDAAACILFCAEAATRAGLDAVQPLGGQGYINDIRPRRLPARRQDL